MHARPRGCGGCGRLREDRLAAPPPALGPGCCPRVAILAEGLTGSARSQVRLLQSHRPCPLVPWGRGEGRGGARGRGGAPGAGAGLWAPALPTSNVRRRSTIKAASEVGLRSAGGALAPAWGARGSTFLEQALRWDEFVRLMRFLSVSYPLRSSPNGPR